MQKDHIAFYKIKNNKNNYDEKTVKPLDVWFNFSGFKGEIVILLCLKT